MDILYTLIKIFSGFIIAASASILIEVPKQFIIHNGIIGLIAYLIYLISDIYFNNTVSVFLACLIVTLLAHISARIFKAPVTVFYIATFFIFVPGTAIYEFAYYLIQADELKSANSLTEALNIAGAVALGVFIGDSILDIYVYFHPRNRQNL